MGWVESKRMTVGSSSPPSQTLFLSLLSTRCCSKLRTIVCLGRLLQGGAPPLVFVQPVRELLGPSDLSLEILSPFTKAITFMDVGHDRGIIIRHYRIGKIHFNVVFVTRDYCTVHCFYFKLRLSSAGQASASFSHSLLFQLSHRVSSV